MAAGGAIPFTIGFHAKAPLIIIGNPGSVDVSRNMDAALFRIADPGRVTSWQRRHHDTPTEVTEPLEEMTVEKVGRTTDLTRGAIESLIFDSLPVTYDIRAYHSATEEQPFKATIYYVGLFLVRGLNGPFAQPGDLGALVTMVDEQEGRRAAVGLILGGTGGDRCYMMAMGPILDQFGVSLVSKSRTARVMTERRRVDIVTRAELSRLIGTPAGRAIVRREAGPQGDTIVVELAPGVVLPPDRKPASFKGFPVRYLKLLPLKIKS